MIKSCFYCKISWGGEMFFYKVSFPSAVWYLSWRPRCWLCTGEPPEDIPPDLQSGAESEREGGREKDTLTEVSPRHPPWHTGTHTPPWRSSLPEIIPLKPVEVGAPVDASTMPEKAGAMGPPSSQPGCPPPAWSLGWTYPGTPPAERHAQKKHMHRSPAQRQL